MTRHRAEIEGDFVVHLTAMQIRKPWMVHKWLPVVVGMRRMLHELSTSPQSGLLGFEDAFIRGFGVVQYWRSQEQLDRFARAAMHKRAWRNWNERIRHTDAVGIWHETYRVRAGEHQSIYINTPVHGLAAAARQHPH